MRKVILAAAAASAMALAAMPAAAQDWYAQVNTGVSTGKVDVTVDGDSGDADLKTGFGVGAAGGVALGNGLRAELEGIFNRNDFSDQVDGETLKGSAATAFVNVLYDFQLGGISPYVGAGVGYGSTSLKVDEDSVHDQGVAWQLRAGASFPVNDVLTVDAGYRYMNLAHFKDEGIKIEPTLHMLTVGARFKLGAGAK